ncbi:hypothetical protein ACOMHN_034812 [Nucella lapillus]
MYDNHTGHVVIPASGSYLVSIRMDHPPCRNPGSCFLVGNLHVNNNRQWKWRAWNEDNSCSGQSVALHFNKNDRRLFLRAEGTTRVGIYTMMSVAFVGPDPFSWSFHDKGRPTL